MTTSLGSRERIQPNGILNALWPMGQVTFYSNPKLYHFVSFKRINLYHGYLGAPRTEDTSMAWCPHFCHNVTSIMTMYRAIIGIFTMNITLVSGRFQDFTLEKMERAPTLGVSKLLQRSPVVEPDAEDFGVDQDSWGFRFSGFSFFRNQKDFVFLLIKLCVHEHFHNVLL